MVGVHTWETFFSHAPVFDNSYNLICYQRMASSSAGILAMGCLLALKELLKTRVIDVSYDRIGKERAFFASKFWISLNEFFVRMPCKEFYFYKQKACDR